MFFSRVKTYGYLVTPVTRREKTLVYPVNTRILLVTEMQ